MHSLSRSGPGTLALPLKPMASSFETFLHGWLVRQEHLLNELLSARQRCNEASDEDLKDLIIRVISHYEQYYAEKSIAAHRDIYLVYSPTWFSALERSMLWIAGFKPGLVPRLVTNSINDLSEEQTRRINMLVEETKAAERTINDEMARIQESIAAPPMLTAARRSGEDIGPAESVIESLKSALENVLASADSLRTTMVMKAVEMLSPTQNIKFFAAAGQFQMGIRNRGLQRDEGRH